MSSGRTFGQILELLASPDISVTIFDLTITGSFSPDSGVDLNDDVAITFGTDSDIAESYDNANAWLQWNDGSDLMRLSKTTGNLYALGDGQFAGGNLGIPADADLLLMALNLLTVNGAIAATGNLITGANLGIAADTDLLALASNLLTVNGALTATGSLLVDGTNIGITADPDLLLIAANLLTVNGALDVTDTAQATNGFILDKTSGLGIRIDTTTPTFGWRDLLGDVVAKNTGGSKPTFTIYQDDLLDYQFAVGDEEYFKFHIPHDYVIGTDIHLHVHWSHIGGAVTGGTVTFGYEISYSQGHNQAAFSASVGTTFAGTASTVQYRHIISEVQVSATSPSADQIDSDDLEPDGVILARLELSANNITVSSGGAPAPFIHYVDIHYQSTNISTKQRVPDFYT